jgi:DNA-binding NtrC family response regulator
MGESRRSPVLLSFEGSEPNPLSIRARALIFSDPASERVLSYIQRIGASEAPVLINGETGTGKELVARYIHSLSGRKGPFLAVNCGAITKTLAESELFGHESGAFTGAASRREGWFEAADGGTLFLDEIGDLPLSLQVKLLRVIQEREVVRVGGRSPIPVDVRLVTATNVDLDQAVAAGHFRSDLHYRINIAQVKLPPLRERRGDIVPLAGHFLGEYARRMGVPAPSLSAEAHDALLAYAWPGNIRELENVIHFAMLISPGGAILPEHLKIATAADALREARDPAEGAAAAGPGAPEAAGPAGPDLAAFAAQVRKLLLEPAPDLFDSLEKIIVQEAFDASGRNQVQAASALGVSRNVLRTLLKRYGFLPGRGEDRRTGADFLFSLQP